VLVPRGESEEETLVGSFTKLLVRICPVASSPLLHYHVPALPDECVKPTALLSYASFKSLQLAAVVGAPMGWRTSEEMIGAGVPG
jgi:hypothetical protein